MTSVQPPPISRNSSSPSTHPPHLQPFSESQSGRRIHLTKVHTVSSEKVVLAIRIFTLIITFCCLILDIVSINFFLSHHYTFPFDRRIIPKGTYVVFMLIPDVIAVAMISILLWKRIRLPDRMWALHTFCRVLFSLGLVVFALFGPIFQIRFFARRENGWVYFFCQETRLPRSTADDTTADGYPSTGHRGKGNKTFEYHQQTLLHQRRQVVPEERDDLLNNCRVMRARSMLTFLWTLLVLLELLVAYQSKEFQRQKMSRGADWTAQESDLNKWAYYSSSEIWDDGEGARPSGSGQQGQQQQQQLQQEQNFHEQDHQTINSSPRSKSLSDISMEYLANSGIRDSIATNEIEGDDHRLSPEIGQH